MPSEAGMSLRSRRGVDANFESVERAGQGTRVSLRTRPQPSYKEMEEDAEFLGD